MAKYRKYSKEFKLQAAKLVTEQDKLSEAQRCSWAEIYKVIWEMSDSVNH